MGRPKKVVEAPVAPEAPKGAQASEAPTETPAERAQRISREVIARKKADADKRRKEAFSKASAISETFMEGDFKPMFLPYKDRDGEIVTCLVTGFREDFKRKPDGDLEIDPKTREAIPQFQLLVWVFSGASQQYQTVYDFEANKI